VHLRLLGRFQVHRDGEEVPPAAFGGRKVRTLLRVLAVRGPDLVPHEVLAEALWPVPHRRRVVSAGVGHLADGRSARVGCREHLDTRI
jgi:DNA-binding SARP family transcriptional activator